MTFLVTGVAGFIGFSTARALLARGDRVLGIDNLNSYYDPALKQARLKRLSAGAATGISAEPPVRSARRAVAAAASRSIRPPK